MRRCRHASSPVSSTTASDLALADAHLDATAGERGVDRVVVAIDPQIRLRRDARHRPAITSGIGIRQRPHPFALLDEPFGRDGAAVRCTRRLTRSHQPSSCSWKSSGFANRRPGRKLVRMNRCERSSTPLAWASPASRITQPTPSCPQNAANASVGRPSGRDRALAIPDQLLRQCPEPLRQRPAPRMSGASLEKISAPASTRDQHNSQVTTQPRRSGPDPTGIGSRGSHRSHCTSSPGR